MELKQLERFLAVVDNGTLAAAARSMGLTQQALSASLSGLEAELQVRLFDRAPGGITKPTAYGDALVAHARSQIAGDQRARQEIRSLRDAQSGVVTVGIGETFAGDIITGAVSEVHRERPQLRINLVEGYSELILERLYRGEFDFVAVGVSAFALQPAFEAETIYSARDVVACRAAHPLAARKRVRLADLAGHTWLVPYSRPSDVNVIREAFIDQGLSPPDRFIGSDAYRIGMKLMAANDFLLMSSPALLSSSLARGSYGLRILDIDRPTVSRDASLVTNGKRPTTPAAMALLSAVRRSAARFADELPHRTGLRA